MLYLEKLIFTHTQCLSVLTYQVLTAETPMSNTIATETSKSSTKMNFKKLSYTANDELYEQYPNADWDYDILSSNNNISEDIVIKYPWKPWNRIKLSTKSNIKHRFDKYDAKIENELRSVKKCKRKNLLLFD